MDPTHPLDRHVVFLWLVTLLCVIPTPGHAQQSGQIPSGARIRIRTDVNPSEWLVGTVLSLDADSIRIQPQGEPQSVSIPLQAATRLEISRGRHSNLGKGALIGGIAGGSAGLLLGIAASQEDSSFLEFGTGEIVAVTGILGAVGAGIGALIGTASRSERWQAVALSDVSVRGLPDGMSFRLALQFRF